MLYLTGKAKRFPPDVARRAARQLEYIDLPTRLDDLRVPPGNRLHALEGERKGQQSRRGAGGLAGGRRARSLSAVR